MLFIYNLKVTLTYNQPKLFQLCKKILEDSLCWSGQVGLDFQNWQSCMIFGPVWAAKGSCGPTLCPTSSARSGMILAMRPSVVTAMAFVSHRWMAGTLAIYIWKNLSHPADLQVVWTISYIFRTYYIIIEEERYGIVQYVNFSIHLHYACFCAHIMTQQCDTHQQVNLVLYIFIYTVYIHIYYGYMGLVQL